MLLGSCYFVVGMFTLYHNVVALAIAYMSLIACTDYAKTMKQLKARGVLHGKLNGGYHLSHEALIGD